MSLPPEFNLAEYERDGVVIVRDLFEPHIVERLRSVGEQLSASVADGSVARFAQFVAQSDERVAAQASIGESARLRMIVEAMLGPNISCFMNRLLVKDKAWSGAVTPHQDWPYVGGGPKKMSIFVPLTSCSPENGMLAFYAGSHKFGLVERGAIDVERFPQLELVKPTLNVGDVLISDFLTWHSSEMATLNTDRIILQVVYQPSDDYSSIGYLWGADPNNPHYLPHRWSVMKTIQPAVGLTMAKACMDQNWFEDAEKIALGFLGDSPDNAAAALVLHDALVAQGREAHETDHVLDLVSEAIERLNLALDERRATRGEPISRSADAWQSG